MRILFALLEEHLLKIMVTWHRNRKGRKTYIPFWTALEGEERSSQMVDGATEAVLFEMFPEEPKALEGLSGSVGSWVAVENWI